MTVGIRWSDKTKSDKDYLKQVNDLYLKGLELVKGGKLYGYSVNINNPKEVIAVLFLLAQDYNNFHERF